MNYTKNSRLISGLINNKQRERLTAPKRVTARLVAMLGTVCMLALGLLLAACPDSSGGGNGGGNTTYGYLCENGTPVTEKDATVDNITRCQSCSGGFKKTGDDCVSTQYICSNGTLDRTVIGKPSGTQDEERCESCSEGYLLTTNNSCTNDLDGDGILNENDRDDDNDGLIEISSLFMLHNMRYNLSGTSYKTSSSGSGKITGAPTATNKAADYACSGNSGLCGYELTQDLTFDQDGDGKTFEADGSGDFTLDSDDNTYPYFITSQGGWLPIGDNTNPFVAIFDGNGHTITGLATKRDQTHIGMFGYVGTESHIRNVGLVNNLADYSGDNGSGVFIGGLVGWQNGGSITASYATGSANGDTGDGDSAGGLVGVQQKGSITASYATGSANGGGGGGDYAGMLIGLRTGGSHGASYGFGTATSENSGIDGNTLPNGVTTAAGLTAANAGTSSGMQIWNSAAGNTTAGAWDFGTGNQAPALKYADFDGSGSNYNCNQFPANKCNTLIPGQR